MREIDKQRLQGHIEDWNKEIERMTQELVKLSSATTADYDSFSRVRRLQSARQIMRDQVRDMEQCLRDGA